jgi:predicted dinucleotide-utilizing enzyme
VLSSFPDRRATRQKAIRKMPTRPWSPLSRVSVSIETRVELIADPSVKTNGHRLVATGSFGQMEISLRNNPLPTNPKSSELAALSLVRLIENGTKRVVV